MQGCQLSAAAASATAFQRVQGLPPFAIAFHASCKCGILSQAVCTQAPAASTMEVMQAAFDGQLGEALEQAIPRLQQTSGCIHTLLFDSASSTDPVLTAKELTEAKRSLEVHP